MQLRRGWFGILASSWMIVAGWHAIPAQAADFGLGAGVVGLGLGLEAHYRGGESHWRFGFQSGRSTSDWRDAIAGDSRTKKEQSWTGPFVHYQLRTDSDGGGYVGAAVLRWSMTETLLASGESGTDSTTDLYLGGGYMGGIAKSGYYHFGLLYAPAARLKTETGTRYSESSGGVDLHLNFGMFF